MTKKLIIKTISISAELMPIQESFCQELSELDSISVCGGTSNYYLENFTSTKKLLEYALVGFAIQNIVYLTKLFIASR